MVNTIHCGDRRSGIVGKWQDGARLGEGSFLVIDHNARDMEIATPYDKELARLSGELNSTYIAYGREGRKKAARQRAQDSNAASMGGAVVAQRAKTKGGRAYKNSSWDLVDGLEDGKADLDDLESQELPGEMQTMTKKQRKVYVAKKAKKRSEIKRKIATLSKKRDAYVAKKKAKEAGKDTLSKAMLDTVTQQMKARGYVFN